MGDRIEVKNGGNNRKKKSNQICFLSNCQVDFTETFEMPQSTSLKWINSTP